VSLKTTIAGTVLVIIGSVLVILAAFLDQVSVHIYLIVPVVVLRGPLGITSVLLIFIGSTLLVLGRFHTHFLKEVGRERSDRPISHRSSDEVTSGTIETGGVLFLGPIPFFFGSSKWKDRLPSWWVLFLLGSIMFIFLASISILMVILYGS